MKPSEHAGHVSVSAWFEREQEVDQAIAGLLLLGIPRDQIEVAVGGQAAQRFYGGKARRTGNMAIGYAAAGALIGFLGAAAVSLLIILWPGFRDAGVAAFIQLLGPNIGALVGAVLGLLIGFFVRKKPRHHYRRALERQAILLLVHDRPQHEIEEAMRVMTRAGGQEPLVDA